MPFFDIPDEDALPPEVRALFAQYRRDTGRDPTGYRIFALAPRVLEARVRAQGLLFLHSSLPAAAKNLAFMLIAHRQECRVCFAASRAQLDALGFDQTTLDAICAAPEALPLPERDRTIVDFVFRVATDPAGVRRVDLERLRADGFSDLEIQEMIGLAAFVNLNITFTKAQPAWMDEPPAPGG